MNLAPTPVNAGLAGTFSGLTWPAIWPFLDGSALLDTVGLLLATVVLIALPAHAFVLGFRRERQAGAPALDHALLIRIGTWISCAVSAAALVAALRAFA